MEKKREEPKPQLPAVVQDLTPALPPGSRLRVPLQPPCPVLETPSATPDGLPFLLGLCPQPPSTVGVAARWGSRCRGGRRAVQLACTGQAERRKLGARSRPGCQGCRRPEHPLPASPGADRPPPSLSGPGRPPLPTYVIPGGACQETAPGLPAQDFRGPPGQVLAPWRLLVEPGAGPD